MPVDAKGNNLQKIGLALTGRASIANLTPELEIPTKTEFAAVDLALGVAFRPLGLRTDDGAPEWTDEPGEVIELYEDGYELKSGASKAECKMVCAQTDPMTMELKSGTVLDENGVADIDLGGNDTAYVLYTEEVFKTVDGGLMIERRMAEVTVSKLVQAKPEKGKPRGNEITFKLRRSDRFGGKHMRFALLSEEEVVAP